MNLHERISGFRILTILGVLATSLLLRADGCVTSEREIEGVLAVTITAEWETRGFTENTATDNGNAGDFAQEILDVLEDADLGAIRAALEAGDRVTVAGMRAEVTRSEGHDASRTATVRVNTGSGFVTLCSLAVPGNAAGQIATPGDGTLAIQSAGVTALQNTARLFLDRYLDGDVDGARATLDAVLWEAAWSSTPPPSQGSPDDFDWITEVVLHVPARYTLETIGR